MTVLIMSTGKNIQNETVKGHVSAEAVVLFLNYFVAVLQVGFLLLIAAETRKEGIRFSTTFALIFMFCGFVTVIAGGILLGMGLFFIDISIHPDFGQLGLG
jgi:hypothetical protein